MNTLSRLALGVMGKLRPRPARGESLETIDLPPPEKQGGLPLMEALAQRRSERERYASVAAGAISQNVYLFAASAGLSTVLRAWIDRGAISHALGLTHDQQVLLSQTVGFPKR